MTVTITDNLIEARVALVPLAILEIGYAYFYATRLYSSLPKYSIGWLCAWALMLALFLAGIFGQMFIFKSITGKTRVDDEAILILTIVATGIVSIALILLGVWRSRSE